MNRVSRRIRVDTGTQDRETADLTRRLKGTEINYRFGIITKQRAKQMGTRIIDDHYNTLLRLTRGRLGYNLKRDVTLTPEDRKRLDGWRSQAIKDFEAIIDDTR